MARVAIELAQGLPLGSIKDSTLKNVRFRPKPDLHALETGS